MCGLKAVIKNGKRLKGSVQAPPSKSEAIRAALLLALSGHDPNEALSGYEEMPVCDDVSAAVAACGALTQGPEALNVGGSAALLRMLLPVSLALYGRADIIMEERLAKRGLGEFEQIFGIELAPKDGVLHAEKTLLPGSYKVDCRRSSQFLSGLLLALPLLKGDSEIEIIGKPVSKSYADMTISYASLFGARIGAGYVESGKSIAVCASRYSAPKLPPYVLESGARAYASGDCSYAAMLQIANFMGGRVDVRGIIGRTLQPDIVFPAVVGFGIIDISDMPDLLPPLAAAACHLKRDTVLRGTGRLAHKESSRVYAMAGLIRALGGSADADGDELVIHGSGGLAGGYCDASGDHRLAMAAAMLAGVCKAPMVLNGAESVKKSAPGFWDDYKKLGGEYEFVWE